MQFIREKFKIWLIAMLDKMNLQCSSTLDSQGWNHYQLWNITQIQKISIGQTKWWHTTPVSEKMIRGYKKIFIHTLQMIMTNSWFLYNSVNSSNRMPLYDFRLQVVESLLPTQEETVPQCPRTTKPFLKRP